MKYYYGDIFSIFAKQGFQNWCLGMDYPILFSIYSICWYIGFHMFSVYKLSVSLVLVQTFYISYKYSLWKFCKNFVLRRHFFEIIVIFHWLLLSKNYNSSILMVLVFYKKVIFKGRFSNISNTWFSKLLFWVVLNHKLTEVV